MAEYSVNDKAYIALSMLDISYKKKRRILDLAKTPSALLSNAKKAAEIVGQCADERTLSDFSNICNNLDAALKNLENQGVKVMTIESADYPELLREIAEPPLTLYLKGDASLLNRRAIAVVGTRRPTRYGLKVAEDFTRAFVRAGLVVVSGFARGLDSAAHRVCVEEEKPTVAVFGCGLNVCYPAENRELMKLILSTGGLLVSEYALDVKPDAYHFPERNRIISGLCEGVFLAEASEKSGSLITVGFAAEQGRDVYIVPGNINSPASAGSNRLLREGANFVITPDDVLSAMGIYPKKKEEKAVVELNLIEQQIVEALYAGELHFEELMEIADCSASELSAILTNLEICGILEKTSGNYYILL
jgi:DNA processing protein